MVSTEDVKKLAALARISIDEQELPAFTKEFESILAYVGELDALALPTDLRDAKPALRNVFRADEGATPEGTWTGKLTAAFPEREGDALVVKKIISHD